jgi:hypothetical protein
VRRSRTPLIVAVASGTPATGSDRLARDLAAWFAKRGQRAALVDLSVPAAATTRVRDPPSAEEARTYPLAVEPQGADATGTGGPVPLPLLHRPFPWSAAALGCIDDRREGRPLREDGCPDQRRTPRVVRAARDHGYSDVSLPELPSEPAAEAIATLRFVEQLRERYERVVVHADCGFGSASVAAVLAADVLVIAGRAGGPALVDAYAVIKWLTGLGYGGRVGVVICGSECDGAEAAGQRLAAVAAQFLGLEIEPLGSFSDEAHDLHGARVFARSAAQRADGGISQIAIRLDSGLPAGPPGPSVWLRVANLIL